jgi:transcriptional regulator with XRE-family HTH domain
LAAREHDNLSQRRHQLGEALRALREARGVSGRQMGGDLGWNQSKISRTESAINVPPIEDIRRWLEYCGASEQQLHDVLALAELVAIEVVTHRELNRGGHAAQQRRRIQHEVGAQRICVYQPEFVPGLLQTAEYIRRLFIAINVATAEDVGDSVAARIERQAIVHEGVTKVDAVITETALAWQPGPPSVSVEQLDRLRTLMRLANVRIGIVSREQQRHAPVCNSFVLTEWPDRMADVVTESLTAEVTITDPVDVEVYREMYRRQTEYAAYGDEALPLLARVAEQLD